MNDELHGTVIKGVGGLYSVMLDGGNTVKCRARGIFRLEKTSPVAGDRVVIVSDTGAKNSGYVIDDIDERKNSLIRPPISNIDTLFVTFSPSAPLPSTLYIDKLLSITVYNKISAVVVITKCDLSESDARKYKEIYEKAGFPVFVTSSEDGYGTDAVISYIKNEGKNKIYAFSGASGVGKSTLINALFPSLSLKTGYLSEKIERGKHTTRTVELYPIDDIIPEASGSYIADTPGFSMLDFINFDFFSVQNLPDTFPEFRKYAGDCRYRDCTHTKEEGCAVITAVSNGEIAKERHESYLCMYADLAPKPFWKKEK